MPTATHPTPEPDADDIRPLDDEACQRALAILVDVGTSIALELKDAAESVTLPARAAAFDRVAQAVRRTVLLSRHIAETAPARDAERHRRALAAKQVIRAVQDEIEKKAPPAETVALRLELLERVESPEFCEEIAARSPGELIRDLCRDLGLADIPGLCAFPRRTPDEIALLCAQAAAVSGVPRQAAAASGVQKQAAAASGVPRQAAAASGVSKRSVAGEARPRAPRPPPRAVSPPGRTAPGRAPPADPTPH